MADCRKDDLDEAQEPDGLPEEPPFIVKTRTLRGEAVEKAIKYLDDIRAYASGARKAGMEEAARICDGHGTDTFQNTNSRWAAKACARAIRAAKGGGE